MFKSASAISSATTASEATSKALLEAQGKLQNQPIIGALVFASSHFDQTEIMKTATNILGTNIPVAGASTAGEISQSGPSKAPSVSVILFASDTVTCDTAVVTDVSGHEDKKGAELAQKLHSIDPASEIRFFTIYGDGLTVNPNGILRGIESVLPNTSIAGGSAGDDGKYKQTFQYCNGEVYSNAVAAMAFRGALDLAISVRHGWTPISGIRTVTKSEGSLVHEIDGKVAIDLYTEFIGDEAQKLKEITLAEIALSYPIGLIDKTSKEMVLRAPFYVDANGSITFGGEVPEGSEIQLMIGSREQAIEAAKESGKEAVAKLSAKPEAVLIYSCHVRDSLYESRDESKLEIEAIQAATGSDVPLAGFYTYAEQAPVHSSNLNIKTCNTLSHNETIVTVLLSESHD